MRYLTFLFLHKSLKFGVHFILIALLNLDATFSLKILDLNLDYLKFAFKKVDAHTQVSANILKNILITEPSICL